MSQENVEAVRRIYEGWRRGDFTVGADLFAADVEFRYEIGVDRVDVRGPEAMAGAWGEQLRNWSEWHTGEIEELREVGDSIIAFNSIHGVGKRSGAAVEMPDAACMFTFRHGEIVRLFLTDTRPVVLAAAGLSE